MTQPSSGQENSSLAFITSDSGFFDASEHSGCSSEVRRGVTVVKVAAQVPMMVRIECL